MSMNKYFRRKANETSVAIVGLAALHLPENPREFHKLVFDLIQSAEDQAFQDGKDYASECAAQNAKQDALRAVK